MSLCYHSLLARNLPEPSYLSKVMALRITNYAKNIKHPNLLKLKCPDCGRYPKRPVTGYCGHTRCTICIEKHGQCPCSAPPPLYPHVDVVVQELLTIMCLDTTDTCDKSSDTSSEISTSGELGRRLREKTGYSRSGLYLVQRLAIAIQRGNTASVMGTFAPGTLRGCNFSSRRSWRTNSSGQSQRQPISIQERNQVVCELIMLKCYKEAVPHLAILAATKRETLRSAYVRLLAQVIEAIPGKTDPRVLAPELFQAVFREGCVSTGAAQLRLIDLECKICYNILKNPVTTPCGHSFCRNCIQRLIANKKQCALCRHPLKARFLHFASENHFINVILASLPVHVSSVENDFIPVFNCTTIAFPSVSCHLMVTDPRACHVVRRILDTGSRKLGMVCCGIKEISDEYGTVLEVKDCVQLKNGCFLLSTVGVSRFKILEMICIDGVMMAGVERHMDVPVPEEMNGSEIRRLKNLKSALTSGLMSLLDKLGPEVKEDITAALGPIECGMDTSNNVQQWWRNPDGANWLWWLVAVLPLTRRLQMHLLTENLKERLNVVALSLYSMLNKSETDISAMVCEKFRYPLHLRLLPKNGK